MKNLEIKNAITQINLTRLKFVCLILVGYSIFILITDFVLEGIWISSHLTYFKILDIFLAILSLLGLFYFWFLEKKSAKLRNIIGFLLPLLVLVWASIVTGIEFSSFGFTTFIFVLVSVTYFIYLRLATSIIYFSASIVSFLLTLYYIGDPNPNFESIIFVSCIMAVISILLAQKTYVSKIKEIKSQFEISEMNCQLQNSKSNLEKKVQSRTEELRIAKDKAEESDKLKTAFLHSISHEFRTPMNSILGFSDLLANPNLQIDKRERYSDVIKKASFKLLDIVTDTIEISQINSETPDIKNTMFNFQDLIQELIEVTKPEIEAQGLELIVKLEADYSQLEINSDKYKIFRSLKHLLDNAIKFTKEGSIEFVCKKECNMIIVTIKDSGIGIETKFINKVFNPFYQIRSVNSKIYGGNGVGLSLAKSYIEMIGGNILLKSKINRGTSVITKIPCMI